jgi:aryl-alcohol dehydrogenase-like predicted oxidoreductase
MRGSRLFKPRSTPALICLIPAIFYGSGHNEMLIGEALIGRRRDQGILSVKFCVFRDPDGSVNGFDNRPAALRNFIAYSLKRLGVEHIDI